jgi:hypothetical protein
MIGSAAIKNNTVRSLDLRNNTIQGVDVRDGSLTAADFSGTMRGVAGPAGKAGPAGRTGPQGPPGAPGNGTGGGPDSIALWNIHHDRVASNPNSIVITSSDDLPAATQIEAVKLTVTGDFTGCGYGSLNVNAVNGQILATSYWDSGSGWLPAVLPGGGFITSTPTPVRVTASCGMGGQPVPDFDASLTLASTARSTTATTTFN